MSPLRVGLCGLGDAGRLHARALAACTADDGVAWTAFAARDHAGVARFRDATAVPGGVVGFGSLDELLASGTCDAVVLATPDALHATQAIACAARHHHVLVEKPFAPTPTDARAIVDAARATGVRADAGYHLRHHAGHRAIRARLAELVGTPRHVAISWAWPDPAVDGWRARGEQASSWSLSALGTHALDLVTWLTGKAIARIAAVTEPPTGIDRAAVVALALEGGALAEVACAVTHRAPSRVFVAGELGEVACVATLGAHGAGAIASHPAHTRGAVVEIPFTPEDPYRAQLRAFAAAVAARAPTDAADLLGNVEALARIQACRVAGSTRGPHAPR